MGLIATGCYLAGKGRFRMAAKSIGIVLQPVYIKNDYFYIPARHTAFFPPGFSTTAGLMCEYCASAGSLRRTRN